MAMSAWKKMWTNNNIRAYEYEYRVHGNVRTYALGMMAPWKRAVGQRGGTGAQRGGV